ncbi:MAG: 1-acyl-sn-glycerol-3-phosphate acyltransferase [Clostridia bacterium]|nr:1-acyl-sn-glycerol-3-phosphate acyltransferase [Clostridia bacterium]
MNKKHRFFYALLRPLVIVFLRCKFGYSFKTVTNLPDNYIVLSNHATDYDPLFVGASFKRQMYFVASEHIARWGFVYKLLKFVFAPIVRYKGTVASSTVMEMLRKLKKGDNVCLFAEGVRTWDGVTNPIHPSTAKLIKSAGCALVTYKIIGGYFTSPMWSSSAKTRKGFIKGFPVKIYTKEELGLMTAKEIHAAITQDLHEDAYLRQENSPTKYRGKNLADGMEALLFVCPKCGGRDSFSSKGNDVACTECGFSFSYNEYGMLENAPVKTLKEAAELQRKTVSLDIRNGVTYKSEKGSLSTVSKHIETLLDSGMVELSADELRCGGTVIPLSEITDMAMHGKQTVVFTAGKSYYELVIEQGSNALKFLLFYNECKNKVKERC